MQAMPTQVLLISVVLCVFHQVQQKELTDIHKGKENASSKREGVEEFKATNEWQTVKKGQPIPKGLHVRINLQTGETEAKLMSKSESEHTSVATVPESEGSDHDPKEKDRLIKESLIHLEDGFEDVNNEEDIKRVKKKFRSYEELKEKFKEINMTVKTDVEVMNEILSRFKSKQAKHEEIADDEILSILTDLEYLVHQFDNAHEFVRLGGFTDVLPLLNATRPELRSGAAHLVGSAAQSNPKVQIAALESGSMGMLLRAIAFDNSPVVRARALYALSCLIRNFPAAQDKMVKEGGLSVLAQLFSSDGQDEQKLQMKTVTLIHDLMLERRDTIRMLAESISSKDELNEKLKQYKAINLEQKLVEQDWCSRIPQVLMRQGISKSRTSRRDDLSSAVAREVPIRAEHDTVEKILDAMLAVSDICLNEFQNNKVLMKILFDLQDWYNQLATRENIDQVPADHDKVNKQHYLYYSGLAQLIDELMTKLKLTPKDEL